MSRLWSGSPGRVLLGSTLLVGASTIPLSSVTGYGTVPFQVVAFSAWNVLARMTSAVYADTHHGSVWVVAAILNMTYFLIPATGIYLPTRRRWPTFSAVGILAWLGFYLASLFVLFPAKDGP